MNAIELPDDDLDRAKEAIQKPRFAYSHNNPWTEEIAGYLREQIYFSVHHTLMLEFGTLASEDDIQIYWDWSQSWELSAASVTTIHSDRMDHGQPERFIRGVGYWTIKYRHTFLDFLLISVWNCEEDWMTLNVTPEILKKLLTGEFVDGTVGASSGYRIHPAPLAGKMSGDHDQPFQETGFTTTPTITASPKQEEDPKSKALEALLMSALKSLNFKATEIDKAKAKTVCKECLDNGEGIEQAITKYLKNGD